MNERLDVAVLGRFRLLQRRAALFQAKRDTKATDAEIAAVEKRIAATDAEIAAVEKRIAEALA